MDDNNSIVQLLFQSCKILILNRCFTLKYYLCTKKMIFIICLTAIYLFIYIYFNDSFAIPCMLCSNFDINVAKLIAQTCASDTLKSCS